MILQTQAPDRMSMALRPYQAEQFIAPIRAAYARGAKSVLAVLPTGGGKTVSFSYMAEEATKRGRTVGIVAHRIELLDQISRTLNEFNVRHGFIAPDRMPDLFAPVQVCSVQTLARRIERIQRKPFDFLIVDEAHHCAAGTSWHQVAAVHLRAGKRVLGVTATPRRLGGQPLSDAFEELVTGPTTRALMDLGALCDYRAWAPATPDMAGVHRRGGDYAKDENEAVMDKPTITGDMVREYLKRARGKRALAFCVSVAHAEHVAAQFRANDIPAASLDGKMDRNVRRETLRRFEAGEVPVLTSCDLVSEGFDVPAIEAVILGRPTQSLVVYLQQVGRALRPFAGKDRALILDHAGNIRRFGLPDDEREWSLAGADSVAKKRGETSSPVRICEKCFGVFRPGPAACPLCGAEIVIEGRKVKEVDGDLEEIDREEVRRLQALENRRAQGMAKDLPSLAKVAVQQGRAPGWIRHIFKARGQRVPGWGEVEAAMIRARQ